MPDTTQARLGFVGAGGHANNSLYPSFPNAPTARLAAVCDLDRAKAERTAKQWGADRVYTDVDAMLDQGGLDGVIVCGEPNMHRDVGLQVLRRGLPVAVEKPSAMTAADARLLAEQAERAGTWGMVFFMKRHSAAYGLAKSLIEAPAFGGLQQLHVRFTQGEYPDLWGMEAPLAFLVGQVVHIFDLTRFLGGHLAQVHARRRLVTHHRFGYAVSVAFTSGAVGTLELNTLDHQVPWRDITEYVHASGVSESLSVEDMLTVNHYAAPDWRPEGQQAYGVATKRWQATWLGAIQGKALTGYVGEVEHFAQCCLAKQPATAGLWDGVESLRFAEAVWESANTGRAIDL